MGILVGGWVWRERGEEKLPWVKGTLGKASRAGASARTLERFWATGALLVHLPLGAGVLGPEKRRERTWGEARRLMRKAHYGKCCLGRREEEGAEEGTAALRRGILEQKLRRGGAFRHSCFGASGVEYQILCSSQEDSSSPDRGLRGSGTSTGWGRALWEMAGEVGRGRMGMALPFSAESLSCILKVQGF